MTTPEPTPPQSSWQSLAFLGVTVIVAIILLLAPPSIQRLSFLLIVVGGLVLSFRQIVGFFRQSKHQLKAIHQNNPLLLARFSFVMTVILIGLSAYFYQPQYIDSQAGFYLFVLSLPFFRLSFPLLSSDWVASLQEIDDPPPDALPAPRIRWFWIAVSLASMALLTTMNIPDAWMTSTHRALGLDHAAPLIQVLMMAIGILGLLLGFGIRLVPHRPTWERHHYLLLGIILLATFIRLWDLEHGLRFLVDEVLFVRSVNSYITGIEMKILVPTANSFADIFSFFQYAIRAIIGPGLTALRIPSAIFGVLGVAGVYVLGRQLFSLRVALISALLVAVMPIYVHYSRIGLNNIAGGAVGIWVFVYLLRGMRHQRLRDYAIMGILLGLTHYFHEGDRLFITPFLICWLIWVALICRKSQTLNFPTIKQLAVLLFTFVVVAAPFYHAILSHNQPLAARFNIRHDPTLTPETHLDNLLFHSQLADLGFPIERYIQIEMDGLYYQSEDAFVLPMLAPFFLIGLAYLLWRIRTHGASLLFWWAVGVAVGNSLIIQHFSAVSPRYVTVYPILMMIAAVGISVLWSMLVAWFDEQFKSIIHMGFIVFLLVTTAYNCHYYFNDTVPRFHKFVFSRPDGTGGFRPAIDDMMLRALALPSNTDIHIFTKDAIALYHMRDVPLYYGRSGDEFVVHNQIIPRLRDEYFLELPRDWNYVFAFTRDNDDVLDYIENFFTITKIEGSPYDIPDEVELMFYYAPLEVNQTLPEAR